MPAAEQPDLLLGRPVSRYLFLLLSRRSKRPRSQGRQTLRVARWVAWSYYHLSVDAISVWLSSLETLLFYHLFKPPTLQYCAGSPCSSDSEVHLKIVVVRIVVNSSRWKGEMRSMSVVLRWLRADSSFCFILKKVWAMLKSAVNLGVLAAVSALLSECNILNFSMDKSCTSRPSSYFWNSSTSGTNSGNNFVRKAGVPNNYLVKFYLGRIKIYVASCGMPLIRLSLSRAQFSKSPCSPASLCCFMK